MYHLVWYRKGRPILWAELDEYTVARQTALQLAPKGATECSVFLTRETGSEDVYTIDVKVFNCKYGSSKG